MKYDYIVVGQGVAGSVLSFHLLERGKKVLVINQTSATSSSMVAGGLINPITGKKMQKTWNADKLFPYLFHFYSLMQEKIGEKFFYPTPIYRPFLTISEKNEWAGISAGEEYHQYIRSISDQPRFEEYIVDEFGGLELGYSGFVDMLAFLNSYKRYLEEKGAYLEGYFDDKELLIMQDEVEYKGIKAQKILFCDGRQSMQGAYFNWLPFSPVKGEVLTVKLPQDLPMIFNRGVFIVPGMEGVCKVGSTYEWQDLTELPTEKGLNFLKEKLEGLLKLPFEVISQQAGVRPASKDRKPFLGLHPKYKTIGIFNGLGTKGVSLAPYYAKQFCDFMENVSQLDSEVNISRFIPLYYH